MSAGREVDNFPFHVQWAQTPVQWWNQLIWASGGALNPLKCCCKVHFWSPNSPLLHEAVNIPINNDPILPPIPVLAPHDGTWYLGIYVNQAGTTKPMETHIWHKAVLYTKAFQQTHMSHQEAGVLYCLCSLPALFLFPPCSLAPPSPPRMHSLTVHFHHPQQNRFPLQLTMKCCFHTKEHWWSQAMPSCSWTKCSADNYSPASSLHGYSPWTAMEH